MDYLSHAIRTHEEHTPRFFLLGLGLGLGLGLNMDPKRVLAGCFALFSLFSCRPVSIFFSNVFFSPFWLFFLFFSLIFLNSLVCWLFCVCFVLPSCPSRLASHGQVTFAVFARFMYLWLVVCDHIERATCKLAVCMWFRAEGVVFPI